MADEKAAPGVPAAAMPEEDSGNKYDYKITVKDPAIPSDASLEVFPFGPVENGKSIKVTMTASEADRYRENPNLTVARA